MHQLVGHLDIPQKTVHLMVHLDIGHPAENLGMILQLDRDQFPLLDNHYNEKD